MIDERSDGDSRRGRETTGVSNDRNGERSEELLELTLESGDGESETALVKKELYERVKRTTPGVASVFKGLKFGARTVGADGWIRSEIRFHKLAVDRKLPKRRFSYCIGMGESKEFAGELFDALCRRGGITSGSITKEELRLFWEQITDHSFDSRLYLFFDMMDKNADGRITKEEVKQFIALCASTNKLPTIEERADEYAALVMEELDPNNLGFFELYTLEELILQDPIKMDNPSLGRLVSLQLLPFHDDNPIKRAFRALAYFVEDNWKQIWVMTLWLSICATLFTWKFIEYKHRAVFHAMGSCATLAKGAAETLKFNMALILLPVCRNTITWLRSNTKLGMALPFDDNIHFHKVISFGIGIAVGIHAILHLSCVFPRLLHKTDKEFEPMKAFFGDDRPNNYWWFIKRTEGLTGITMLVLMTIAYILAQPWFRQQRLYLPKPLDKFVGFNAFWHSHHLFIIVYALFIVHGSKKTALMYLVIPMILYVCERLLRAFRSGYKSIKILKVALLPGDVLVLLMSKPQGFKYYSGQYIFVNCSDISPLEWHPFFISSSPGDDDVSVHIKTLGDWTTKLKEVFAEACQPTTGDQSQANKLQDNMMSKLPNILIDGPYGSVAQNYNHYEVIILMGLGIGITPFVSILKDIVNNIKEQEDREGVGESVVKNYKLKPLAINRAYFYWITREQRSFEWFKDVMDEAVKYDKDGVIEFHNYLTSVYEEGDARSVLIKMLQFLYHAKSNMDIFSDTRVKTHSGKPNWYEVFKNVAHTHPGKRVGVFYCGTHVLFEELKQLSLDFSRKTNTKFDFHDLNISA